MTNEENLLCSYVERHFEKAKFLKKIFDDRACFVYLLPRISNWRYYYNDRVKSFILDLRKEICIDFTELILHEVDNDKDNILLYVYYSVKDNSVVVNEEVVEVEYDNVPYKLISKYSGSITYGKSKYLYVINIIDTKSKPTKKYITWRGEQPKVEVEKLKAIEELIINEFVDNSPIKRFINRLSKIF